MLKSKQISYLFVIMTMCVGGVSLAPTDTASPAVQSADDPIHEIYFGALSIANALPKASVFNVWDGEQQGQLSREVSKAQVCNLSGVMKLFEDLFKNPVLGIYFMEEAPRKQPPEADKSSEAKDNERLLLNIYSIQEEYQKILKNISKFISGKSNDTDSINRKRLVGLIGSKVSPALYLSPITKREAFDTIQDVIRNLSTVFKELRTFVNEDELKSPYNLD